MLLIALIVGLFLVFAWGGIWGLRSGYYGAGGYGTILALIFVVIVLVMLFGGEGFRRW